MFFKIRFLVGWERDTLLGTHPTQRLQCFDPRALLPKPSLCPSAALGLATMQLCSHIPVIGSRSALTIRCFNCFIVSNSCSGSASANTKLISKKRSASFQNKDGPFGLSVCQNSKRSDPKAKPKGGVPGRFSI